MVAKTLPSITFRLKNKQRQKQNKAKNKAKQNKAKQTNKSKNKQTQTLKCFLIKVIEIVLIFR